MPLPGDSLLPLNLLAELALLVPGIINGMASWVVWHQKSEIAPGRGWVIVASLLNLLTFMGPSLLFSHEKGAGVLWVAQAIGMIGLIAFSRAGGPFWAFWGKANIETA
ncbi:MAG TPA: hypothetical protein VGR73_19015 [Bryobacteraceae bacterium]|nr:hypothetical protein [Bryobacteraceae bacterium]